MKKGMFVIVMILIIAVLSAVDIAEQIQTIDKETSIINLLSIADQILLKDNFNDEINQLSEKVLSFDNYSLSIQFLEKTIGKLEQSNKIEMAYSYALRATKIAKEEENYKDIAYFEMILGVIAMNLNKIEKSLDHHKLSLNACKIVGDKNIIALALNNVSTAYSKLGKNDLALTSFLESVTIKEELQDTIGVAITYMNIGNLLFGMDEIDRALEYLYKANTFLPDTHTKKINLLESISKIYRSKKNFVKAKYYLDLAESLDIEMNPRQKILFQKAYGHLYYSIKDWDKSEEFFLDAYQNRHLNNLITKTTILSSLISICLQKSDYEKGKRYYQELTAILPKIPEGKAKMDAYESFYNFFLWEGDKDRQLKYLKKFYSLKDTLRQLEKQKIIENVRTKFETKKREQEIKLLQKDSDLKQLKIIRQQNRLIAIIVFSILLVIFIFVIYRIKQQEIEAQKRVQQEIKKLNKELESRVREELQKRQKQQQQLIQKSKLESIGKLAAGIAHEINQPLGGISMGLENIYFAHSEGRLSDKYMEEKLEFIDGYIERINHIIDNIRTFSREQKTVVFEEVDINETIKKAVMLLRQQFESHGVELSISSSENSPKIKGNRFKLEQIILNLLSNAKDALDEKEIKSSDNFQKKIDIKTYEENQKTYIEIVDNGCGIPEDYREKIFDPFFTTKDSNKGTGLGLSIIFGLIQEMNGSISVESEIDEFTKMIIEFKN